MNRRGFLSSIATVSAIGIAGCLGGNGDSSPDEPIEGDASDLILSESVISDMLPGSWVEEGTRPPKSEPVGMESAEIKILSREDGDDELEHGISVFDSIENAESFIDDEREEDYDDEDIGDESFSTSALGSTVLLARVRNVVVQEFGTPHISNQRQLAKEQIKEMTG